VDLSTYSSPRLTQFRTNITAVAKAVLDAFDAGNFCGTTLCSTCGVTTPCGVPPAIEPPDNAGVNHVQVSLMITGTVSDFTGAALRNICGRIARAAGLAADAATCTVSAASVIVTATLAVPPDKTVQEVTNRLNRVFSGGGLPASILSVTVDSQVFLTAPASAPPSMPPSTPPSMPPSTPPGGNLSTGASIGIIIGALGGGIVVAVVVLVLCRRLARKPQEPTGGPDL
jgi:hypothetical protein